MPTKKPVAQQRFKCPHCGTEGWWTPSLSHVLNPPQSHDRPDGRRCLRAQQQVPKKPVVCGCCKRRGTLSDLDENTVRCSACEFQWLWRKADANGKPLQLLSGVDATAAKFQHKKPCSDCPWARVALPGWLGKPTAEEWLREAHGESRIDCHTLLGAQCAGAATYRANVGKLPRDPKLLRLESDKVRCFANPAEFKEHHSQKLAKPDDD